MQGIMEETKLVSIISPITINNTDISIDKSTFNGKEDIYLVQIPKETVRSNTKLNYVKLDYSKNSIQKPIYTSELFQKFKQYRWFTKKKLYINFSEETAPISVVSMKEDELSSEQIYQLNCGIIDGSSLVKNEQEIDKDSFDNAIRDSFSSLGIDENEIDKMAKTNEIYLLNNSKGSIDFLNNQNTSSLIEYDSDKYTNTIDIKKLLSKKTINAETAIKVDLTIQYSVDNNNIMCFDITFEGIHSGNDSIKFNNSIHIMNDIKIEYLNGIITLFPLSSNIIECIISNCLITYGKF